MVCAPFRSKTFGHLLDSFIAMHIFHTSTGLLNLLTEEVRGPATQCLWRDRGNGNEGQMANENVLTTENL